MKLLTSWKNKGHPSVFANEHGTFVHTLGYVYFGDVCKSRYHFPESRSIDRCIAICGGNVRRGLMLYAEHSQAADGKFAETGNPTVRGHELHETQEKQQSG